MKLSNLFFGLILILFGTLFLLENLDLLQMDWEYLWKLWPVLIIFWGVSLFPGKSRIIATLLTFLVIVALLVTSINFHPVTNNTFSEPEYFPEEDLPYQDSLEDDGWVIEPLGDGMEKGVLELNGGAGSLSLEGTTENLIAINTLGDWKKFNLRRNDKGNTSYLEVKLNKERITFGRKKNVAEIRLNDRVTWDLEINTGASSGILNLTPFRIKKLDLVAGASEVELTLGDKYNDTEVRIEGGIASIKVKVPESSGCRIISHSAISSENFEGFIKSEKKTFVTPGFEEAQKKITIYFETGISEVSVERIK